MNANAVQIRDFALQRLDNGTHFDFVSTVNTQAAADEAIAAKFPDALATLTVAAGEEDRVLVISQKSPLTQAITNTDELRDMLYKNFYYSVQRLTKTAGVPAIKEAADILAQVLKDYKIRTDYQYDRETGLLTNLCQDLLTIHRLSVEACMLTSMVEGLQQANNRMAELLVERDKLNVDRETGAVKAARAESDKAYRALVLLINACAVMEDQTPYVPFILYMNSYIKRLHREALKGSGGNSDVDIDIDIDVDEDVDSDTDSDVDSGSDSDNNGGGNQGGSTGGSNTGGGSQGGGTTTPPPGGGGGSGFE